MTDPTPLSPAAQAVLDAFDAAALDYPNFRVEPMIAAALRAVADHGEAVEIRTAPGMFELDEVIRLSDLLAIAAELEAR